MKILGILSIVLSTVTLAVAGNTSIYAKGGDWHIENVSKNSINVMYSHKNIKTGETSNEGPTFLRPGYDINAGATSSYTKPIILSDKSDR